MHLKVITSIALLFFVETALAADCKYTVLSEWDNGFTASITISNTNDTPIEGWSVFWDDNSMNTIQHGWSAEYQEEEGYFSTRITASNLSWNRVIQPGQSIDIGFIGNKNNPLAETPTLKGTCTPKEKQAQQYELDKNISLWQEKNIQDYVIEYNYYCYFCPNTSDIAVTVSEGNIVSAHYVDSQLPVELNGYPPLLSVEELFTLIQRMINYDNSDLSVQYEENYGYPITLFTDPSISSFDDERGYYINDFKPSN